MNAIQSRINEIRELLRQIDGAEARKMEDELTRLFAIAERFKNPESE